jgi:hypothetical protein
MKTLRGAPTFNDAQLIRVWIRRNIDSRFGILSVAAEDRSWLLLLLLLFLLLFALLGELSDSRALALPTGAIFTRGTFTRGI